jgi:PAS domain S-box-containing protein
VRSSIRQLLLAFGAAVALPVLVFAAILAWQFSSTERLRYESTAREEAEQIITAADRELTAFLAAGQALAAAETLTPDKYEAFYRKALLAAYSLAPGSSSGPTIIVKDLAGQQVVNTSLPRGAPLRSEGLSLAEKQVLTTERPTIADLVLPPVSSRPSISVHIPVLQDEQITHVLGVVLSAEQFAELLRSRGSTSAFTIALIDRNDRVIARSRDHETFVGKPATEDFRRNATGRAGTWEGRNLADVPVLAAYARSDLSGWRAAVGVPLQVIQRPLNRSLWVLAALAAALAGAASLMAFWVGRKITGPVSALTRRAKLLGLGKPIRALETGLYEIDSVADALAAASATLEEREASLRESEARLRATQENAAVGIAEVDRHGCFVYVNEALCRLTGYSREQLVGHHFTRATHETETDRDLAALQSQIAGECDIYTIEKQYVHASGATGWVRVSSSAVRDRSRQFLYAVRIIEEITVRKESEERQQLLVHELNHRVKNTLATVQSLARQSLRQDLSPEIARDKFEARVLALSRTHNLLNESGWEGASMRAVLRVELEPYGTEGQQYVLTGPDLDLPPRVAVPLGMAFHELATNAIKYGALSVPGGCVLVDWECNHRNGRLTLSVAWREVKGPAVSLPSSSGFGTRLLRQAVERELAGNLEVTYEPGGLVVRAGVEVEAKPLAQDAAQ